ncbi:MAG TPA: MBL fold metallo-hydrolase [Gemmatimonadaceae bacterium]|nr:MBL fold metallo-hydrolase [Gemmatimonadaceae bacterium]
MTEDESGARNAAMRVRFWGTRGSIPSPGPDTTRYGGNTPCVTVALGSGVPLIFDAGTGIRALGISLDGHSPDEPLDLFLSHTHWDHIQGLPFFAPMFRRGTQLRIWGSGHPERTLEHTIQGLLAPDVFPVSFDAVGAAIEFRAPPLDPVELRGMRIRAMPVRHPGGALAYRIDVAGVAAVVYVPDNELRAEQPGAGAASRDALREASRGAALLIHDGTYTEEESADFMGWGHSTTDDALQLALDAGVKTLALFHHAPGRTDEEIDGMVSRCAARAAHEGAPLRVVGAAEGMELVLKS